MLSKSTSLNTAVQDNIQLVSFNISEEIFAIDIVFVQEIIRKSLVLNVPLAKNYVEGIMNIRGTIIPIINLRLKMGYPYQEDTEQTRVIVISFNSRKVGIVVDSMNQVLRVNSSQITPPSINYTNDYMKSICSIDDKLITVLDVNKILEVD